MLLEKRDPVRVCAYVLLGSVLCVPGREGERERERVRERASERVWEMELVWVEGSSCVWIQRARDCVYVYVCVYVCICVVFLHMCVYVCVHMCEYVCHSTDLAYLHINPFHRPGHQGRHPATSRVQVPRDDHLVSETHPTMQAKLCFHV